MSGQAQSVCFALSAEANFENGTWTLEPFGDYSVGAGRYAILREAEYLDLVGQCDELLIILEKTRAQWIHSIHAQECLSAIVKARSE